MATITKTINPAGGGDYSSLSAWNAAEATNLITAGNTHVAECYGGDVGAVSLSSSWYSDSTNKLIIKAADGEQHSGYQDTDKAYASSSTGDLISTVNTPYIDYLELVGLQFWWTATITYTSGVKQFDGGLVIVDKCLFKGLGGDVSNSVGILSGNNSSGILFVTNSVFYDFSSTSSSFTAGVRTQATADALFYNCTFVDCRYSIRADQGTPRAVNNIMQSAPTYGTFDSSSGYNLTNAASAPGSNNIVSTTLTFVDAANDNFALAATDIAAIGTGIDLSSDGTWPFYDDILGVTRPTSAWDIGAFEYVASSGSSNFKVYASGSWISGILNVYSSDAWVSGVLKYYNGSSWV